MRENLFKAEFLEVQDVMDYLLYVAQNAFNRKLGQERNELMQQEWMVQHINDYVASARILGLVDREFPKRLEYDEAWIAGASRLNLFARIVDYKYLLSQGIKITGLTLVLAGERPLWANLDGMDPKIYQKLVEALNMGANLDELDIFTFHGNDFRLEEGKRYIRDLAERYYIALDQTIPCIQYMTKEECPNGLFPRRFYPNYTTNTEKKLTETVMAEDLVSSFLKGASIRVINTITQENQRPTTASTAYDAAKCFISRILSGAFGDQKDFFLLLQTNNPHVERQTLATEREVNRALVNFGLDGYTITIHGAGFGCKRDITAIHSEFAALIAEKWKSACRVPKRDIKDLLFQTRGFPSLIPDVPKEIKDI